MWCVKKRSSCVHACPLNSASQPTAISSSVGEFVHRRPRGSRPAVMQGCSSSAKDASMGRPAQGPFASPRARVSRPSIPFTTARLCLCLCLRPTFHSRPNLPRKVSWKADGLIQRHSRRPDVRQLVSRIPLGGGRFRCVSTAAKSEGFLPQRSLVERRGLATQAPRLGHPDGTGSVTGPALPPHRQPLIAAAATRGAHTRHHACAV